MAIEKVLVVDDDQNICDLLRMYLERENYSVIISNDGKEAVNKFNALNPDFELEPPFDAALCRYSAARAPSVRVPRPS